MARQANFSLRERLFPKPKWKGTPETFLAMVIKLNTLDDAGKSKSQLATLGERLMNSYNIKLHPFFDFQDLLDRGTPDFSLLPVVTKDLKLLHKRISLGEI